MQFTIALSALLLVALASTTTASLSDELAHHRRATHHSLRAHSRSMHRIPLSSIHAHRRATAEQEAQAAALAKWNESFHAINAEWQQAANAALAQGKTAMSFEEYAQAHGFSMTPDLSDTSSAPAAQKEPAQKTAEKVAPAPQKAAEQPKQEEQKQQPKDDDSNNDEESCDDEEDATDEEDDDTCDADADTSSPASDNKADDSKKAAATTQTKDTTATKTDNNSNNDASRSAWSSGKATFYDPSVGAGSCGKTMAASDYIVALNSAQMTESLQRAGLSNPNLSPLCWKKLLLKHNGKQVEATITDTCPGCQGDNAVDLSPALFNALATDYERESAQSFTVEWAFA